MKTISLVLLLFLSIPFATAQIDGQINGRILGAEGEEIAYATILLKRLADSTLVKAWNSELDGSFSFQHIQPGKYFIEITYVGYADHSSGLIEVTGADVISVPPIKLVEKTEELAEVVVKAARPIIEIKPDKTVFNVEGSVNATGNDALELLRKAPGVLVDNNDKIMLLGRSGVRVYINGKPTHLSTDDLAQYLKTLPSSEIEAIEIITNPSAKYEAAGNAGIINIRLKKDKNLGLNANLNSYYGIGMYGRFHNSLNFNYRNKKLNLFGNYGNSVGKWTNYNLLYREQVGMAYDQDANMWGDYLNHRFRLGADYFISEKSTIGVLFNGYNNEGAFHNTSEVDIFPIGADQLTGKLHATNDIDQTRNNLTFNANYAYDNKKETTLNVDVDYGRFRNDGESYQPNFYMDATGSEVQTQRIFSSHTPTTIDIYTLKLDYEKPLWQGKISLGAKYSSVGTDNTFDFFDVVAENKIKNLDRSNQFDYLENVSAAYISFQRPHEKWNFSLGLRAEHTYSNGELSSDQLVLYDRVKRDYLDLFPSGGVTYQLNDHNSFRLNYSRRLDRPSYQDLNPFEFKLDELTFLKGNAFLKPQYSNNISLTHTLRSKLNSTLSYSVTNDLITRITDTLDATANFITYVNLDKQKVLSLAFSYPFTVNKWWNVFANLSAYRTHNKANFEPGKFIDITATGINTYAQNTFLLPRDIKFELSGFYRSPWVWAGNFEFDAIYGVDIGIRKKLFEDRATLKITVSDIFKTNKVHGSSELGGLKMTVWSGWDSRQFRVNFNYLLGNREVKGERRRKTGLEDEQKRIKTDEQN